MKWDIDKALKGLESSGTQGTLFERILINPEDQGVLSNLGLKLTPALKAKMKSESLQLLPAWALGVGKSAQRKLFFHAWTLREAYLKARRGVKKMTPSDLAWYGLTVPKKSNSYAAAKRKAMPRKKSDA